LDQVEVLLRVPLRALVLLSEAIELDRDIVRERVRRRGGVVEGVPVSVSCECVLLWEGGEPVADSPERDGDGEGVRLDVGLRLGVPREGDADCVVDRCLEGDTDAEGLVQEALRLRDAVRAREGVSDSDSELRCLVELADTVFVRFRASCTVLVFACLAWVMVRVLPYSIVATNCEHNTASRPVFWFMMATSRHRQSDAAPMLSVTDTTLSDMECKSIIHKDCFTLNPDTAK